MTYDPDLPSEYYRFAHGNIADPDRHRGSTDRRFDPKEAKRRKRQRAAENKAVGHAANVADFAQQDFDLDDYRTPYTGAPMETPELESPTKGVPMEGVGAGVKAPSWLSSLFTRKPSTVEVKKGDSLSAIAKRKGISLSDMLGANSDLKNPNMIKPGQLLKLPKGAK